MDKDLLLHSNRAYQSLLASLLKANRISLQGAEQVAYLEFEAASRYLAMGLRYLTHLGADMNPVHWYGSSGDLLLEWQRRWLSDSLLLLDVCLETRGRIDNVLGRDWVAVTESAARASKAAVGARASAP